MSDPHGPSAWTPSGGAADPDETRLPGAGAEAGQYGAQQYPGYPQQGQYPGYGDTRYPGQPQYGAPAQPYPGQQYPEQPQYGQQYPDQQQYGQPWGQQPDAAQGQPAYPDPAYGQQQYPDQGYGQQYGSQPYGAQYPGQQQYPPPGQDQSGSYGAGSYGAYTPPPTQRGNRTWLIVAALAVVVVVVGGVIAFLVLNRSGTTNATGPTEPATPAIVRVSSTPDATIPDDSPSGVTDTITVDAGTGTVERIDVSVRFEHRYPREVSGVLTSPSGDQAVVVDGTTTSVQLSSADAGSPLQGLVGGPLIGPWRLTLTDGVAADAGRLVSWDLALYPQGAGGDAAPPPGASDGSTSETGTSAPGIRIPDDVTTGVTDAITLEGPGTVESISVSVSIQHELPSDLVLELRSPSGRSVTLADHDRSTSFAYDSSPGEPLAELLGEQVVGAWTLSVVDDRSLDEGELSGWQITVNG